MSQYVSIYLSKKKLELKEYKECLVRNFYFEKDENYELMTKECICFCAYSARQRVGIILSEYISYDKVEELTKDILNDWICALNNEIKTINNEIDSVYELCLKGKIELDELNESIYDVKENKEDIEYINNVVYVLELIKDNITIGDMFAYVING